MAEGKIGIVLERVRGEENISELCLREGIAASMYYGWSMEFLEAGKRRLAQVLSVLFPLHSGTGPFWRTAERELLGLQDRGGDMKGSPDRQN